MNPERCCDSGKLNFFFRLFNSNRDGATQRLIERRVVGVAAAKINRKNKIEVRHCFVLRDMNGGKNQILPGIDNSSEVMRRYAIWVVINRKEFPHINAIVQFLRLSKSK